MLAKVTHYMVLMFNKEISISLFCIQKPSSRYVDPKDEQEVILLSFSQYLSIYNDLLRTAWPKC